MSSSGGFEQWVYGIGRSRHGRHGKTRLWVERCSGPVSLSPSRSCPGCTIITSGYDFRKGQPSKAEGGELRFALLPFSPCAILPPEKLTLAPRAYCLHSGRNGRKLFSHPR